MKVLIFGIGNPGRQDDGVGPHVSEELERRWCAHQATAAPGANGSLRVDFDSNYQLMIEDALTISEYDTVYFIDATHAEVESFRVTPVEASEHVAFSTHSVDPGGIVALSKQLYDASPQVYLVEVRVESWEIAEPMTEAAFANAARAVEHLLSALTAHNYS